jgi:L-threonylcarbamoyladenylate synthase
VARIISAQEEDCVSAAVQVLRSGGIVCLPTDTVYGLAAVAANDEAVARIFAIKGRRQTNPLPIFISDASELSCVAQGAPQAAERLIEAFWPGALTIVLPKATTFQSLALVGGDTVGVRAPGHDLVLEIARELGEPMTGTSANLSGLPSPSTVFEADGQIGERVDLLIDGGRSGGLESTIIDMTGDMPKLVRAGAIGVEELERVLGTKVAAV